MTGEDPLTRPTSPEEGWIRSFAGLFLEVEAGFRPARHLRPLLHVDLHPALPLAARRGATPEIHRVLTQRREAVCEAVVLLRYEHRVSALVLTVERHHGAWRVTEIRRPEDPRPGPPPDSPVQIIPRREQEQLCTSPCPAWRIPAGWSWAAQAA